MSNVPPQYLTDASGFAGFADDIFIPADEAGVLEVLEKANRERTPVTVAGAGSGLTGGRVPQGGVVLSLEKFRHLEIREGSARVGCAVTLLEIRDAAARSQQFFAPGSDGDHGVHRRSHRHQCQRIAQLSLWQHATAHSRFAGRADGWPGELVSPRGQNRFCSARNPAPDTMKNTAGYRLAPDMDWIDLFCGSEGTLGVILEAEIALLPIPRELFGGVIFFPTDEHALDAVDRWRVHQELRMLEYVDQNALHFLRGRYPEIPAEAQAALLIEAEGADLDVWESRLTETGSVARRFLVCDHAERAGAFSRVSSLASRARD